MKKIIFSIVMVIFCLFAFNFDFVGVRQASAADVGSGLTFDQTQFSTSADGYLNEFKKHTRRLAGTDGEKQAGEYIAEKLKTLGLTASERVGVDENGLQKFGFTDHLTGNFLYSNNIIFNYSGGADDKKLIVGCNYDAVAYEQDENGYLLADKPIECEAIVQSASNVATLLAVADIVSKSGLSLNIEFVFFGAGESNQAGSKFFVQGITDEEKKNIIGMVNIDSVVGENTYFYVDEVDNDLSKFVSNFSATNNLKISKLDTIHLGKVLGTGDELGLGYTHIALCSDNISFMKESIGTVSLISGNYSNGLMVGRNEFASGETLSYTANDNSAYLTEKFGTAVSDGMARAGQFLASAISSQEFLNSFASSQKQSKIFYDIFANEHLVIYLTAAAVIIFVVIAMYMHYRYVVKAYHANVELEFLSSVIKITEQIEPESSDENVAKVVSKVLAEDIKRDKTIKRKRRRDSDDE